LGIAEKIEYDPTLSGIVISRNVVLDHSKITPTDYFQKLYFDTCFSRTGAVNNWYSLLGNHTARLQVMNSLLISGEICEGSFEEVNCKTYGIILTATKWYANNKELICWGIFDFCNSEIGWDKEESMCTVPAFRCYTTNSRDMLTCGLFDNTLPNSNLFKDIVITTLSFILWTHL
jgi:hypothetical protein